MNPGNIVDLTADIVSAYVAKNPVPVGELGSLIKDVHKTLTGVANGEGESSQDAPKPAVNPKKSVYPDYIICLEDGKKFKSLKRHLRTHFGMTPAEYREKWGLPTDYPMVAPNYAAQRSELAKLTKLGHRR